MSQSTRDYKKFDYKHSLVMSASQLATFAGEQWQNGEMKEGCQRKWAFQKVWKLPVEDKGYLMFGTVLHEACERWLEADDTGRNPDGSKLDLWPKGWDEAVSYSEAALIITLVEKAIEEGMLVRYLDRKVELPIQMPVLPKKQATLIGYVDLDVPDMVIDHKTTSNFKWAKTSDGLADNTQLLVYGAHVVRRWMKTHGSLDGLDFVTLRHNVFLKNEESPAIRPTQAQVSPERIIQFWDEIVVPSAKKMLEIKKSKLPVTEWSKVEGPTTKGTCRKYGGCPYAGICGGRETPAAHRARIERLQANQPSAQEKQDMTGLFDKLKAKKGKVAPAPAKETKPEAEEATPLERPTPAEELGGQQVQVAAPWANPNCRACGGRGLNKKGTPCRACVAAHERDAGKHAVDPSEYELEPGKGFISIRQNDVTVAQVEIAGAVKTKKQSAPKGVKKVEAPKEEEPAEETSEAPAQEPKEELEAVKTQPKKKRTTKPKTVTKMRMVYGNVRIQRGKAKVVDMADILRQLGDELAETQGKASYYSMNAFARRDMLAQKAEEIAQRYAGMIVTVQRGHPDVEALAAVLEPFAEEVVEGTR